MSGGLAPDDEGEDDDNGKNDCCFALHLQGRVLRLMETSIVRAREVGPLARQRASVGALLAALGSDWRPSIAALAALTWLG